MVTGRPFRIDNIRANREKPGLLRQHLTAVQAAAQICSADVVGAELGARQLTFTPGPVKPGEYRFAVGSAGSTTLVLQAVLPALLCAGGPSSLTLEGGTHNPHAPPLDFLERAFLPLINRMGPKVHVSLERYGFYPAGGGRFFVNIEPSERLTPLVLDERGNTRRRLAKAVVAGLPGDIAKRELVRVEAMLGWTGEELQIRQAPPDQGPGNILTLEVASEHVTEVFTGFGMKGVTSEAVAEDAIQQARHYLAAQVPVGACMADQLLIPLAMAGGGRFRTVAPSRHTRTNADIVRRFMDTDVSFTELLPAQWCVEVGAAF
jgi:RNA 3'-terminal phosphate cyclase (ATP)